LHQEKGVVARDQLVRQTGWS